MRVFALVLVLFLAMPSGAFADEGEQAEDSEESALQKCPLDSFFSAGSKKPIKISDLFSEDSGSPIKPLRNGCYEGGMFVGIPVKASNLGTFYKSKDMEITVGKFIGNEKYLGQTYSVSTDDAEVLKAVQAAVDTGKPYIFFYQIKHWANPEAETHRIQITAIAPYNPQTAWGRTPNKMKMDKPSFRSGGYSTGKREGRIVSVARVGQDWNWFTPFCTIDLELGGLSNSSDSASTNMTTMALYGEEACRYAEALLQHDSDVVVEYAQDYVEFWHRESRFVTKISLKKQEEASVGLPAPKTIQLDTIDPRALMEIKKALLEDEDFLKSVSERVRKN